MSRVGKNEDGAVPGATPRTPHRAWLAVPAVALALAASACGSSASPATSTAAGSAKVPLAIYAAGWAAQMGGVPQMESYVSSLVKGGAKVYNAPADELNAIKQGTIDVAVAQSSYGIGVKETNPTLNLTYPQYVTPVPSVLAIDAKAPAAVQAEAKKFVQFVLSPAGQRAMQAGDPHGDSLYWSVINGVAPLPKVPSPATIPTKILNPVTWGAQENTVAQWFTSHIAS